MTFLARQNSRIVYLSPQTADRLNRWLDTAKIDDGPVFRVLHFARVSGTPLETSSIRRLVKRAANRAGVSQAVATCLSGYSMRVGAAQDMLVAGFDALAIMQAGGWKSPNVLLCYVENAATKKPHERRCQTVWDSA
ncbi:MAG: tyrosine-type recombinase/integrase [Rhodospirillales bacterium]|nr:tyrosine-type recombinase/integrase [Rhodospirillales bacterium]